MTDNEKTISLKQKRINILVKIDENIKTVKISAIRITLKQL